MPRLFPKLIEHFAEYGKSATIHPRTLRWKAKMFYSTLNFFHFFKGLGVKVLRFGVSGFKLPEMDNIL